MARGCLKLYNGKNNAMYSTLKRIAKFLIPQQILKTNETRFRRIVASKYAGNNFQCNLCNFKLNQFVIINENDLLCPNCGSLSRTRRLYKVLRETPLTGKLLHFSPPKALATQLYNLTSVEYITSDFESEFDSEYQFDVTSITQSNNSFSFIICYHILEHIENDLKAMTELYRVLRSGGCVFIQTPYKDGSIYEDRSIKSPKQRKLAFGQEDHVRIYSLNGLNERLKSVGFKTKIHRCSGNKEESYNGFLPEVFIEAIKPTL